ncbi:FAD-binding oxidoreductase [Patulibacter sp. NPDC049589]|uniref:FAD-binding oxidoreductase n=1 Tax=Patulibacter sp. NPDC049589 TaxID=3154731 RepID=UPI0034337A0F
MERMKWWGWGREDVAFTHEDKPALRGFIQGALGIDVAATPPDGGPPAFSDLDVPPPVDAPELRAALLEVVGAEHLADDDLERIVHARGKSIRDLIKTRQADIGRVPDIVVEPADEDEVSRVVRAILDADAVLIPFGGGTNISGSLEAPADETRPVVSVDLRRLDRVLEVDDVSRLARVEAGIYGPALEEQLNARGWTAGHFPDSFAHSTLGGWIATRSSGMQSDKYGDIADLTRAVRMVTPTGVLATRPVPSTATGPSVREMVLGSEGRLGVITEATIHVHRIPEKREILAYLLPDWSRSLTTMRELSEAEVFPSVTRVSDARETQFSFATRKKQSLIDKATSAAMQRFLGYKGIDPSKMCLSFVGYEGSEGHVKEQQKRVAAIVKRHGGLSIGASPGALYDAKKFDTPYIRDFLLDRGSVADVSETAAPWSALAPLYEHTVAAAQAAFDELGTQGYVMCHLSHSYHAGACLYFTFAMRPSGTRPMLEEYDVVKVAIQQSFVDHGATLSHHHAVGTEHAPWLEQDLSAPGVEMIRALLHGVDPGHNLNPGKIVP